MTVHGSTWRESYDTIVVGGGTAGAIVAARLSEDSARQVLLLEAGEAALNEATLPAELSVAGFPVLRERNWNFDAILRRDGAGRPMTFPYPMARVLGGGSAINGSVAILPRRKDFETWAAAGNDWWSWREVQTSLLEVERTAHRGVAAEREEVPETALRRAFFEACADRGWPPIDIATSGAAGVGLVPQNVRSGRRLSTATLYLQEVWHRPNLTIVGNCEVQCLQMKPGTQRARAMGVEVLVDAAPRRVAGKQIVMCAGAIGSPTILLRSGIGPAPQLERDGVRVVLDLPGVGRNLQDHPVVSLWAKPERGEQYDHAHQAMLQLSSSAHPDSYDLQLFLLAGVPAASLQNLIDFTGAPSAMGISVVLAAPRSTGCVTVQTENGRRLSAIDLNCLDHSEDLERIRHGVRVAWDIMHGRRLETLMGRPITCSARVVESDAMLDRMLKTTVRASWHPVGTLRMGRSDDALAVASEHGLIRGCDNVYVADASLMPGIPRVPTNLTCMLIGERVAAHLRTGA